MTNRPINADSENELSGEREGGFIFPLSLQVEILAAFGKTFADNVLEVRIDSKTATVTFFTVEDDPAFHTMTIQTERTATS